MNSSQRKDLYNTGSRNGLKTSDKNPNVQYSNGHRVIHTGENTTIIDGKKYHGHQDAKNALNNLNG